MKRRLGPKAQLRLLWGATLLHADDAKLLPGEVPTLFTSFKNKVRP